MYLQEELTEMVIMTIKIVVFDLWNTLVYDPSKKNHDKIAKLLGFEDRYQFWKYCDSNFFHKDQKFYEFLKEIINDRNLEKRVFDEIRDLWEDSKSRVSVFPESIPILKKLKKRYKLAIVSNSSKEEGNEALEGLGLKDYFDYVVLSCEVEISKPDPRIFQLVVDHFGVKPEECVMIGDNLESDIIPARYLGFRAILVDTRKKYTEYKNEDWYIESLNELKL